MKAIRGILIMTLLMTSMNVLAVNYPVYKRTRVYTPEYRPAYLNTETQYCGYSTTTSGGTTTTGEGGSINNRKSRRNAPSGNNYNVGDYYVEGGQYYIWNGEEWIPCDASDIDGGQNVDPGVAANGSPIGDALLPMLLFSLLSCGGIFLRRRKCRQ